MRYRRAVLAAVLVGAAALTVAAPAGARSWAHGAEVRVSSAGVMAPLPDGLFHGEQRMTAAQLDLALQALAAPTGAAPVQLGGGAVTITRFHRAVVAQLGLTDVGEAIQSETARVGLAPPARYGDEVVARRLGLRFNHPEREESRELYPWDEITRSEAAWSLARVLSLTPADVQDVRDTFSRYVLPDLGPRERRALRIAASRIGMPYIWGGETDGPRGADGPQAHGGYDCSGFVWRVFKLSGDPAGRRVDGRTAASQAGEIARGRRLALDAIRPGDLLFFGRASFHSTATERSVDHVGIALSADFMINASSLGAGVYVQPLFDEWRRRSFAWGRRIL